MAMYGRLDRLNLTFLIATWRSGAKRSRGCRLREAACVREDYLPFS
jgi:hypothetical protein